MEEDKKERRIGNSLTKTERYYWELSEVYLAQYHNATENSTLCMMMQGVIVEMQSDVEKYLKNNPNSKDKVSTQQNRINVLNRCVDAFTITSERNYQIRYTLNRYLDNENKLKEELEDLKRQLEIANAIINES